MTSDGLPTSGEPPIPEATRQRGIDLLTASFSEGKIELEHFQQALDALFGARTEGEFASVVRTLPPPVVMTPPSRRRSEPLTIESPMSAVRLVGRWQVSRTTLVTSRMGSVTVDLTDAEFDAVDIDLAINSDMGSVKVIVPRGFDVRLENQVGMVKSDLEPPIPGFPILRLTLTSRMGTIRISHPDEKKPRRARRRRRDR